VDINKIMAAIKAHPDYAKAGMVLYHNGIVRESSRDGRPVNGLRVAVDREKLADVLATYRQRPGIVDIQVDIAADRDLAIGDDVMLLAVAGDVRENVIETLRDTLNTIKKSVTTKTEFFV